MSVSGLLVDAMPPELPPSRLYEVIGKFISVPHIGLIWWFGLSLLDDRFRVDALASSGMAVTMAMLMFIYLGDIGLLPRPNAMYQYALLLVQLALIVHIIWVCFSGFRDDLINARRNFRLVIAALPATVLLIMLIVGYVIESWDVIKLIRVVLTLPVALILLLWLTRFQVSQLSFAPKQTTPDNDHQIRPEDRAVHARLLDIVEREKAYLEPDLTAGSLAERVGIPAHQLRALINRSMGFRNFSQFLASYRIDDIKVVLADPDQARVPILTIALNGGFSSLTTFNRTFRAETGQSAGAYRKQVLGIDTQI